MRLTRFIIASLLSALLVTPAVSDSLGSAVGGQAAPQSNMIGGLCLTAPTGLTNGQQAGVAIDCNTHALIVTGAGGGGLVGIRPIQTGATDFATAADAPAIGGQSIFWNSATASPKTENLPACSAAITAGLTTIVDQKKTAGTYPITILPNGTDTINGIGLYVMNFSQQSVTLQCNGSGAWVVE